MSRTSGVRQRAASVLRGCIEGVVLLLVCVTPWVFGGVEPGAELCLFGGVGLLLMLWALCMLLEGVLTWEHSPVGLALAGLFLFGILQIVPLPAPILRWVSPTSARLGQELLPQTPEQLPFDEGTPAATVPAGATISLYPGATRGEVVRLLAVLLLFAVVRNNCATPAALRRLAVAAVVNGFALALFAFVQLFSAPPNTMYWRYPVLNNLFGPFICHNHFPFYLNICLGLGGGLWLALRHADSEQRGQQNFWTWLADPLDWLNRPALLWVGLALLFMAGSVVFSLSRGGILGLVGALVVCLLIRIVRSGRLFRPELGLLIVAAALGLLVWFGLDPLQARLATLWQRDAAQDARLPVWLDGLRVAKDFPLFGTGFGTFLDADVMYRLRTVGLAEGWENAHNDYVEALVEGGAVRLLLSLVVIALVYRQGLRALRKFRGRSAWGLAEGALFAFTTVVIHSFVDFGLHVQAIAVLATAVAAHLCALGSSGAEPAPSESEAEPLPRPGVFRFGGVAPLVGAVAVLALGWVLCVQGWRWARAYSLEVSARELAGATDPRKEESRLAFLEAATQTTPEQAYLHLLAAQAYLDVYQERLATAGRDGDRDRLARTYLTPALRHYLVARDLCPLMAKPHVRIAADVKWLEHADPRDAYLHRAELVYPRSAEVWYVAGLLQWKDGPKEEAWSSWRRSLELSPEYLPQILDRAHKQLGDTELADKVLPDRADVLWAAAVYLYPKPETGVDERRPFLRKALTVLQQQGGSLDAADLHLRGLAEAGLGNPDVALTTYETALRLDPQQDEWRYEYAELLRQKGRLKDSLSQLRTVVGRQPGHRKAQELLQQVARELAERG